MTRLRRSIIKLDGSTTHYSRVLVVLNIVLIVLTILMLLPIAKDLALWPFNHSVTTLGGHSKPASDGHLKTGQL
jgi:hypothetical protein